jgi:hypothetical protein
MSQMALLCGAAAAGDWDKKTALTVNEPFLVPGHTIPAGKYVLKLVDSPGNRHVVRIMNASEDRVIATLLAIPNYRLKPTGNTQFQWWETPRGNPAALRAWFFPGDNFGQEFAYPKGLSARIARETRTIVPTTSAETEAQMKTAPVTAVEPTGEEHELPLTVYRAPDPPLLAQAVPNREQAALPAAAEAPQQLPATASPAFSIGFAGLVSLILGLALSLARPQKIRFVPVRRRL